MIRMKPVNIFDFYAPTGGSTKIADFKVSQSPPIALETPPIVSGTYQIESTPNITGEYVVSARKIQWESWVVGGILVLGTTVFLAWYYSDEQKRKRRDEARYW